VHRAPASPAFDADALLREQTERPSWREEEAGKLQREREWRTRDHSCSGEGWDLRPPLLSLSLSLGLPVALP